MAPNAAMLPRGLRGMVSEGAVSGVWSVGQVRSPDMMDDLDAKAQGRRFFVGMLLENFEDWAQGEGREALAAGRCSASDPLALREARAWTSFLHDDDEHIKAVRGFKSGRREFRTMHAMYRSEASEVLPVHGVNPDTVLVARTCPRRPE
mmetsp:Transcript_23515/g.71048  ORF Transcript_23515/g.71048 Transcript_23515/m.71048 type:complete len:149 (-) Transcript_23515:54-500(-)